MEIDSRDPARDGLETREMYADLDASAVFELRQRNGTRMLYVVEVSEDGKTVTARARLGGGASRGEHREFGVAATLEVTGRRQR